MHRTQYLELKNSRDNSHPKTARLIGYIRNYGHELLNSRTFMEGSSGIMGMNYSTQGLNDTSHLKIARLIRFMRNYGHELLNSRTFMGNM
ncbi:hypothetical protein MTR67_048075 [Solanum verrucosum]|uniref:Uncharacterized protein n=1 Tax=Solanum verrucosum TaxID=315347 RepID=A0AAF0UYY4_SOLVR|nr:hypothetical protein MTR67_048075 [Solanum verrucosum]